MMEGSMLKTRNLARESQNGGYLVTGATESFGAGKEDIWLMIVGGM
jgi:hypothetical protein